MDATSVRSILLRLALVIAVLAGLLAMHTLVTGPSHAAAATALTMEHHPAEPWGDPERGIDADDCGPECVPLRCSTTLTRRPFDQSDVIRRLLPTGR
jgi:hypothetical protein